MARVSQFVTVMITFLVYSGGPAFAGPCPQYGSFEQWMKGAREKAAASGISQRAISAGLDGLTPDPEVIRRDHGQRAFKQSFEQFSSRMVNKFRISRGKQMMSRHASMLARIEKQYGVPGAVLVAIWGLETDFGAYLGNYPTIRSIATLAYDCRRSEMFSAELMDALRIVDRGDMQPNQMHGAWAGEIGQTQFMPSSYVKYAVDFDGDGRRDLVRSVPDVLASTANFLKNKGWRAGAGWSEGEPNFAAIKEWNKANVYAKTIALYANVLDGRSGGGGSGSRSGLQAAPSSTPREGDMNRNGVPAPGKPAPAGPADDDD